MANLAIKGHPTRGSQVIKLLEMLGGNNINKCGGEIIDYYYVINFSCDGGNCDINRLYMVSHKYKVFTLEEFEAKYPYKVGDKVIVNGDDNDVHIITSMRWHEKEEKVYYDLLTKEGYDTCTWEANEIIPYKEQESIPLYMYHDVRTSKEEAMEEQIKIDIPKGYEFAGVDDGAQQVVFTKIQSEYPQTYLESCNVLGRTLPINDDVEGYKWELIMHFQRLLVCRDAYWKIAGEQMRLGKPWEPDWTKPSEMKYCIVNSEGNITKWVQKTTNKILAFPTAEMRDAFYENFKDLIELCKELL